MKNLIVICLLMAIGMVFADTYTIGTGTSISATNPFTGVYNYSWCKTIYTAGEINAAGLPGPAQIIGIGFYVGNSPDNYSMNNQFVYLRHTGNSQYLSADVYYPGNTNFEIVFQGEAVYSRAGWHYFRFSAPFAWNGSQNLEFLYENLDTDNPTGYPSFCYTSTDPVYRTVHKGSYTTFPVTGEGSRTYNRANIQLITASTTIPNAASAIFPPDGAIQITPDATLCWAPGSIWPEGYRLCLGTDNPPTNIVENQDLGNATTYNPSPDLEINTAYYWKITPYNNFGDATDCPVWSFTTHGTNTISALPYFQQFDAVTAPALPFDWTAIVQASATPAVVATYASSPYSAPNCVRLYNSSDAAANVILVGPVIGNNLNLNEIRVHFYGKGAATYHLQVGVIANPTDPASFVSLQDLTLLTSWNDYTVSLIGYSGSGRYIAFKHGCAASLQTIYLDDVRFEQIASHDLACTVLSGNTIPFVNSESTNLARIHNYGCNTQNNYSVKLYGANNVELTTTPGLSVAPGEEVMVPLTWAPNIVGNIGINAIVIAGDDANPANDQSPILNVYVQPAGVVLATVGDGNQNERVPLDFYHKNSLHQCLYYQSELNTYGLITSITFYNNFVTYLPDKPCKIWLGQTALNNLSAGWILDGLTLVYDGTISFPNGENYITILLQTPFNYTLGNLVLYANRPMDTLHFDFYDNFEAQTIGNNRARELSSNVTNINPAAPMDTGTLSGTYPKASFTFVTSGMATLTGTVSSAGSPVHGVSIVINDSFYSTETNGAGAFSFPYVIPGSYTVTISKAGYVCQNVPVVLTAGQTEILNISLITSTALNVFGVVAGSDAPATGLEGAIISLFGIQNHNATTNAAGAFTIPNVLSGNIYSYRVSHLGYQDSRGSITVSSNEFNMGTIMLNVLILTPGPVVATENIQQTQVNVVWSPPSAPAGLMDFEQNDGGWIPSSDWTNPLGDFEWTNTYDVSNYVLGAYPNNDFPPQTAHSGAGLWGTVLYAPYTNYNGFSYLTKEVSFTGITNPQMRFWSWNNSSTADFSKVCVNGIVVWGPAWDAYPVEWEEVVIDLSAYTNQTNVVIQFQHYANMTINYAGWYIDDVYLGQAQTEVPDKASPQVKPLAEQDNLHTSPPSLELQDPERIVMYKVWRLLTANQNNQAMWTVLTTDAITDTSFVDTSWGQLPSGVYQYAVKAVYINNVLSLPVFSNELTKNMMGLLSGNVTELGTNLPICGAHIVAGDYIGSSDIQGHYSLPVYAGTYTVVCSRIGYQTSSQAGVVIVGTQTTIQNFVLTQITLPPVSVQAMEAFSNVNLSWIDPESGASSWLHYDSDNNDSIGTNAAADFDVAIRYSATALADYTGMSLFAVKVWPASEGSFSIRVWTGGTPAAPATMVVDQPFTPVLDSYNSVNLTNPVPITGTEELWFGYRCNVTGGYPAGCDAGPAIDGFGNMMYYQNAWTTLLALAPTLNYNWNIQGYVSYSAPAFAPQISVPAIAAAQRNDQSRKIEGKIAQSCRITTHSNTTVVTNPRTLTGYRVWRLQSEQENNENLWTSLTPTPITATNYVDTAWGTLPYDSYKWAVKAVYSGGVLSNPSFSNTIAYIPSEGTIAGIVHNLQNQPIPGTTVTCGTTTATTNNSGAYSMQVNAGVHSVTASHPNYLPVTHDNVTVATGQTTTVNFQLSPSANEDHNQTPVVATELKGNYPNPFNPSTNIAFSIKDACPVKLTIYNLQGKAIKDLLQVSLEPGHYSLAWDGTDKHASPVASGVYYYKMTAGKYSSTRKMILLK